MTCYLSRQNGSTTKVTIEEGETKISLSVPLGPREIIEILKLYGGILELGSNIGITNRPRIIKNVLLGDEVDTDPMGVPNIDSEEDI